MQMSATKKREDEGGVQRDLGEQLLKIGRFPQPPPGYLLSPFYGRGVCRSEHTVPSHRHSDRKSRLLEGWLGCVSVRYDKNSDPEMTVTKATDYPPKSLETGGTANTQDQWGRHQGEEARATGGSTGKSLHCGFDRREWGRQCQQAQDGLVRLTSVRSWTQMLSQGADPGVTGTGGRQPRV